MRLRVLLSILFCLLPFTVGARDFYNPGCVPEKSSSLEDVAKWAAEMDYLGAQIQSPLLSGDYKTKFGSVIDGKSCFEGKTASQKSALIELFENSTSNTILQIQRCFDVYQFREIPDALASIRRATYFCDNLDREIAYIDPDTGTRKTGRVIAKVSNSAGATAVKSVEFPTRRLRLKHGIIPTLVEEKKEVRPVSPNGFNVMINTLGSPEDLPELLFHEALHFQKTDNVSWHNEVRSNYGCDDWDLIFKDRVYFLSKSCFPNVALYQRLLKCPNAEAVCKAALSAPNDPFVEKNANTAIPYTKGDAEIICSKYIEVAKYYNNKELPVADPSIQKLLGRD